MKALKEWLEQREIPQWKAAEIAGVTQGYISLILNGQRNLTLDKAKKFVAYSNGELTLDKIYGECEAG